MKFNSPILLYTQIIQEHVIFDFYQMSTLHPTFLIMSMYINFKRQTCKRQIIWFNPPFSANVKTNVGKIFMRLVDKHFPCHHK